MDNYCEKIQEQLVDYILGILDAGNREKVNRHVNQCSRCRQYKQTLEDQNRDLIRYGENMKKSMHAQQEKAIEVLNAQTEVSNNSNLLLWRAIMGSGKLKLTAAAAIILVAVTIISVSRIYVATPAYAFDQTVDAIKEVKTVHMAGEFYGRGKFECWLRFDGNPDVPTHMWMSNCGHLEGIYSPDGLFHFNRVTHYVFPISQDQRGRRWIIKFNRFFKDAMKAAGKMDAVSISHEETIVVHIHTPKRDQQFLVDPETKLPISFSTIRDDDPMEMVNRQALTLRNIDWIRYNEKPPEGIFKVPADATMVRNDFDCWVTPDSGLVADGMTKTEACLEIARQTGKALIDLDIEKLCKLNLFFLQYAPEHWDLLKRRKKSEPWANEYVITGDVYEDGEFWYVPSEIRINGDTCEVLTMMIKFYEMEGKTICIIVGAKETGVAD